MPRHKDGPISMTSLPLWDHQRKAIETIQHYLTAVNQNASAGAALVHMPTGTGKSGVIATASHLIENIGCVLVLCPRIALRDQLFKEINGRFFKKLGLHIILPKRVYNVSRKFPKIETCEYPNSIIVMTIQMLYSIAKRQDDNFTDLKEHVDLVIVDEGHYEPAISWREAIRALQKPKVIFTATPFRNDLKLFDIDYDYAYSYTFHEAINEKIIRDVAIYPRAHPRTPHDFVREVINFYDEQFGEGEQPANEKPRVIIRCDSQATIRQIGTALQSAAKSFVLIHENFDDNSGTRERRTVPDPSEEDAIFWVHQFKLLEGIDDPRFQVLALYEELRTTRQFVQQVGRVIRNPLRTPGVIAHVIDHSNGRQKELWDSFLEFDNLLLEKGVAVADFGKKLLDELSRALPDIVYLDGRFRSRFSLSSVDPSEELSLPLTVNISHKRNGFDLDRLCDEISSEYEQQDKDFRLVSVDNKTRVFLYLTFRNSPLLRTTCFVECRLGITIIREVGKYLCFYDSGGSIPYVLNRYIDQIPTEEMRRLFSKGKRTHLTTVSLRNSNLGPRAIRSRTISAAHLYDTVPSFDDHSFVCQTALGYSEITNKQSVRRYVGFQRGKITDSSDARATFRDYIQWLDIVEQLLTNNSASSPEFQRYAKPSAPPSDPDPINILLDLAEIQDSFATNSYRGIPAGQPMTVEDTCSEVKDKSFTITANGILATAYIEFDPTTERYHVSSTDLENLYYSTDPLFSRGLVNYLNQTQSFRVIPKSEGSLYAIGEFFSPIMKFGPSYRDDQIGLFSILHTADCVERIGSEKGTACATDGSCWDNESLFAIIDNLGRGYDNVEDLFGDPDIVVCDDLGIEAADFIIADTNGRRVIFVHAKGLGNQGNSRKYAASPLQEICSQATKNLRYFSRFGQEEPPKARKWHNTKWPGAKGVEGEVLNRIRRKPPSISTGLDLWKAIKTIIRDPYANLEVWLFLGRLLSKSTFRQKLTSGKPAAEAKQAAYLIFSTMNDVASVGARLRVICSP